MVLHLSLCLYQNYFSVSLLLRGNDRWTTKLQNLPHFKQSYRDFVEPFGIRGLLCAETVLKITWFKFVEVHSPLYLCQMSGSEIKSTSEFLVHTITSTMTTSGNSFTVIWYVTCIWSIMNYYDILNCKSYIKWIKCMVCGTVCLF